MLRKARHAIAALVLSFVGPGGAGAVQADERTITLGQVGLSFYAVVGGVVQEVLEAEGYAVTVVEGAHAEVFPRLGRGEVDILAAAWLPGGHAALYEPVRGVTFKIGPLYEDATFFWVVPGYVPEDLVSSVADLTQPGVAARMAKRIVSLPAATGLTVGGRRVMEAYGLADAGYELVAASPAEWIGTFRRAVEREAWVVFPLWQPQWVNTAYEVRPLAEPKKAYGDPDTAWLLGHQGLRDKLDEATLDILRAIRLPVAAVTEMDRLVNVEGMTPRQAARSWMADNAAAVAAWRRGP